MYVKLLKNVSVDFDTMDQLSVKYEAASNRLFQSE
jgi:hypothetical protein